MRLDPTIERLIAETISDFRLFCRRFIKIVNAKGELVPFVLNPAQERVVSALIQHNRILMPKARQLGMSTLLRAWDVYQAYIAGRPAVRGCLSHHERSAKHLHKIARSMLLSMPELVRPELETDSATVLELATNRAQVVSFTAGSKTSTRSFTLTSAHLSEFAFWHDPVESLAVILATVHDGQIIIETTANAPGDYFHQLCLGAPENGWYLVFIPWHEHPDYKQPVPEAWERTAAEQALADRHGLTDEQLAWRRAQIKISGSESKFRREYPAVLDDCFLPGDGAYMPTDALDEIIPVDFPAERLYEVPDARDVYAVGVDVAGGVGGDYSAITIVSATTYQPVWQWRSNTATPVQVSEKVLAMAERYNRAMVLVESNNHGHVVELRLQQVGYHNLWRGPDSKPWTTTVKSKLDAFEGLRDTIQQGLIERLDRTTLAELRALRIEKVTPEAPAGLHDDLAMSLALAYRCLRDIPRHALSRPRPAQTLIERRKTQALRKQGSPWATRK